MGAKEEERESRKGGKEKENEEVELAVEDETRRAKPRQDNMGPDEVLHQSTAEGVLPGYNEEADGKDPKRVPRSARRRLETTEIDAESPPGAKKSTILRAAPSGRPLRVIFG